MCEDDGEIVERIDERTLLVPISHVLFKSGEIQDVEPIVRRAHEVGAHVILDCYQSAGIVPLDVAALGVELRGRRLGEVALRRAGQRLAVRATRPVGVARADVHGLAGARAAVRVRGGDGVRGRRSARFLTGTPNVPAHYAATAGYDLVEEVGVDRASARTRCGRPSSSSTLPTSAGTRS